MRVNPSTLVRVVFSSISGFRSGFWLPMPELRKNKSMPPNFRMNVSSRVGASRSVTSRRWITICPGAVALQFLQCFFPSSGNTDVPTLLNQQFGNFFSYTGGGSYNDSSFHSYCISSLLIACAGWGRAYLAHLFHPGLLLQSPCYGKSGKPVRFVR